MCAEVESIVVTLKKYFEILWTETKQRSHKC